MTSLKEIGGLGNSASVMEVSFTPKHDRKSSHYIATLDNSKSVDPNDMEISKMKKSKLKPSCFYTGDHVKGFFFGSVSVLTLYILFRILQKSK